MNEPKRRHSDRHMLEQVIVAVCVGFFGAAFGAYITLVKMGIHVDYLKSSINNIVEISAKQVDIDKRLAVVENELERGK